MKDDNMNESFEKKLEKDLIEKVAGKLKKLSRDELQSRILEFIDRNCVCTLATCSDNLPRSTIVRYRNKDLSIYVFTEGGGKVKNIKSNPVVSLSICGEYTGIKSVKCLQAWGSAEIVSPREEKRYAEIRDALRLEERQDLKEAGIGRVPDMYILKIEIERARYLDFPEGILNQVWVRT